MIESHAIDCETAQRNAAALLVFALGVATATWARAGVTLTGDTFPTPGHEYNIEDYQTLCAGVEADGTLLVSSGTRLRNQNIEIGYNVGASGTVIFTGGGAEWVSGTHVLVGDYGFGTLSIEQGARIWTAFATLGVERGASGMASVVGANSFWAIGNGTNGTNGLEVGYQGSGGLNVLNGGTVVAPYVVLGYFSGTSGSATVSGPGSLLRCDAWTMFVGEDGAGTLNVTNGGRVELAKGLAITYPGGASSGLVRLAGGTIDVRGQNIQCQSPAAQFDFTGGVLANVAQFTGKDLIQHGGTIRPGTTTGPWGTTRVLENYVMESGGIAEFDLSGPSAGSFDRLIVDKSATLDGTFTFVLNNYMPSPGDSFDLIDFGSMNASGLTFDFSGAPLRDGLVWNTSAFATSGVIDVVSIGIIPEPTAAVALCMLAVHAFRRRRGL